MHTKIKWFLDSTEWIKQKHYPDIYTFKVKRSYSIEIKNLTNKLFFAGGYYKYK